MAVSGDVHKVIDIEGIGEEFAAKLQQAGIEDTHQLIDADAKRLAKATGIQEKLVRTWQSMADLMRIDGIGKQFAEVLVRAGVSSVEALAEAEAEDVVAKVTAYLATLDRAPTKGKVTRKNAEAWIREAQGLREPAPKVASAAQPAPAAAGGSFERNGYTLYARDQKVRGEKVLTVYFFSKRVPVVGRPITVPEGYVVQVEKKTGIPFLKKT